MLTRSNMFHDRRGDHIIEILDTRFHHWPGNCPKPWKNFLEVENVFWRRRVDGCTVLKQPIDKAITVSSGNIGRCAMFQEDLVANTSNPTYEPFINAAPDT